MAAGDGWTWTNPQHRQLQGAGDDVSLVFEIMPETPTVALSVGASNTDSAATKAATTAAFNQQSAMADLGTKVLTLAVSGNMSSTIAAKTGLTVAKVQVVPPVVTVTLPVEVPVEVPPAVIPDGSPTPAPSTARPTVAPSAPPSVIVTVTYQGLDASVSACL